MSTTMPVVVEMTVLLSSGNRFLNSSANATNSKNGIEMTSIAFILNAVAKSP